MGVALLWRLLEVANKISWDLWRVPKGSFVVNFKKTYASAVPMDQALEKAYNKPAKGQGGTIGFTRRKEAVAQFNLIRHEKAKI